MALFSSLRGRKAFVGKNLPALEVDRAQSMHTAEEGATGTPGSSKSTGNKLKKRLVRRRSASSILVSQSESSPMASPSTSTFSKQSPPSSASSVHVPNEDDKCGFHELEGFRMQKGVMFHPYDSSEAPYMQAYDHMALENDRHSHELIQKLTPKGSPTFHKYGDKPPARALDLGCGQGFWVVEAASAWKGKGTKVTGLDLVDLTTGWWELEKSVADSISWVRHNFVAYRLPFPDGHFNFVRLCNVNLGIPFSRWGFVLSEVRRVLSIGGRLELLDDQMYFPFIAPPSPVKSTFTSTHRAPKSGWDPDSDSDQGRPKKQKAGVAAEFSDAKSPYEEWEREMQNCAELEFIFSSMLKTRYGLHLRPAEFMNSMLSAGFGRENVHDASTIHVCLPSREFMARAADADAQKHADALERSWMVKIDWGKDEKGKGKGVDAALGPMQPTDLPANLPKKAAAMLGTTRLSPAGVPFQQPGLVVFPSTFLPMSPAEVEMHSSKNLHMLLSCRAALRDFIREYRDESGEPIASDKDLDQSLWDYHIFRRRRFNWPEDLPELTMKQAFNPLEDRPQDPSSTTPTQKAPRPSSDTKRPDKRRSSTSSYPISNPSRSKDGLTFVRSFHLFEATKTAARIV